MTPTDTPTRSHRPTHAASESAAVPTPNGDRAMDRVTAGFWRGAMLAALCVHPADETAAQSTARTPNQ